MRKISLFIKDILENIKKTEDFVAGISFEDFKNDEKTNYALIRCIEIIGEATKRVPDEIKQAYPEIPWRDMAGMRDKLIHFYFGLHVEKIWLVVVEDLPKIKPKLEKVQSDLENRNI
jgi:uncharacterized protein with HEPN domain